MFSFENKNSAIIRNTSLVSSSGISKDCKCNTHTDDCRDENEDNNKKTNQPTTDFLFCFCPYFNKLPMQKQLECQIPLHGNGYGSEKLLWKLLLTFF